MQIKRFSVKGYKNFVSEIVLDELGVICVIHGENNIGKSNLLEAMQLFFQLLCFNQTGLAQLKAPELAQLGFNANEIFSLDSESPITITAVLKISPSEIPPSQTSEFPLLLKSSEIHIHLELQKANDGFECQISPTFFDGDNLIKQDENKTNLSRFFRQSPLVLIGVDRRISESEIETVRNIVPQTLLLKLYDMRDSLDTSIYKWELFVRTLQRFNDVLGEGEFVALFNRHTNRANLAFQPKNGKSGRIPIEILGSGIQQVVALVARLLVSNATFIAIEEPELNLRYTLQLRLREIFQEIVADPFGPQQIFFSSHSPAFEFGQHFYAMRMGHEGPIVEPRPIREASHFTQPDINAPLSSESAPMGYVSSDGLVRLPEYVRQALDIEQGGGVVFIKRQDSGHIELLKDDQFLDLFESIKNETK